MFFHAAWCLLEDHLNSPTNTPASPEGYRIVRLGCGAYSVHSLAHAETFHPVIGPIAEAQALYVRQLGLQRRLQTHVGDFVIWDVGLGAAANAVTILRAARDVPCSIQLLSFDHTPAPLEFGLAHAEHLEYLAAYRPQLTTLLSGNEVFFQDGNCSTRWRVHWADFPSLLAGPEAPSLAKPHLIMFDAFSPAKNPAMWTLPLFSRVFALLDPRRACVLPTYSRSTLLRVTLLLAGFFVGVGHATGEKEQTTVAANSLELIDEPLGRRWLERARRSNSAQPLMEPIYRQAPLLVQDWDRLAAHPQFREV